jgi:hypothetical protein
MTEQAESPRLARRLRPIQTIVRPTYDELIGKGLRDGRLRLAGVQPAVRWLAMLGVSALLLIWTSVVLNDLWRNGPLVSVGSPDILGRTTFVPLGLVPVTLIVLCLAWALFLTGALYAAWPIRLIGAFGFLVANASLSKPVSLELRSSLPFVLGPTLSRVGYFVVPSIIVIGALLAFKPAVERRLRPLLFSLLFIGVLAFFGGHLITQIASEHAGLPAVFPTFLDNGLENVSRLLAPNVALGVLGLVGFSHAVASAAVVPAWRVSALTARLLLIGLLLFKLWIQVIRHLGDWAASFDTFPGTWVVTVVAFALVGAAAWLMRKLPRSKESSTKAAEPMTYLAAFAIVIPLLLLMLFSATVLFVLVQFNFQPALNWIDPEALTKASQVLNVVVWSVFLVAGVILLLRSDRRREIGIGLLIIGAGLPFFAAELFGTSLSLMEELLDVLVTIAVGIYAAFRWSSLTTRRAIALAALVLFTWLVSTRFSWLGLVGKLLGLPAVFIVIVGVVLTLAAGSAFASRNSKNLPRPARLLMWVGFLLISATILNWLLASHGNDLAARLSARTYGYVALPLAVRVGLRRPFEPPVEEADRSQRA